MKIDQSTKEHLEEIYQSFYHNEKVRQMLNVQMHRGSNCFIHSFKVAKKAIYRAIHLHIKKLDLEAILIASILHDYYLYDWRKDHIKIKVHNHGHPFVASENALRDFAISKEVQAIIKSHMWPINIKTFPKTKEARIVMNADTHVALFEALCSRAYKKKHHDKYIKYIDTLF